jgi:lipopolysaccharide exporter
VLSLSVGKKAARGVVWTTGLALVSRAVALVGTLVLTRFIAPEVMGEVVAATAIAFAVNFSTQIGASQYVLLRGDEERDAIFHVTVLSVVPVAIALLLVILFVPQIAPLLSAPNLATYLPGMALVVLIARISSIPDKLLLRRMRFRTVAVANALGLITHTALSILLVATTDLGGMAVVFGHIGQSVVIAALVITACGTASWMTPTRLRWHRFKEILSFGVPLGVVAFLYEATRYGDKLVYTRMFGAARTGEYNLAYSLADLPASYVGEQVAGVLLPALLHVEVARRKGVLIRAIGMLAIVTFPMAVGLGAISSTLIDVLLPDRWSGVAPFLAVLAALSIFRPVSGMLSQYLISIERTRVQLWAAILRAVVLFAGLFLLGLLGPTIAATAVGVASFVHTWTLVRAVGTDGGFVENFLRVLRAPLLACVALVAAVVAVRLALGRMDGFPEIALLAVEIAAGGAAYVGTIFCLARAHTLEALALARSVLRPSRRAA